MSKVISGAYIGTEICNALGLNPDKVQSINLNVAADAAVIVTVTQYVHLEEMKEVNKILTKFNLVPIDDKENNGRLTGYRKYEKEQK